MINNPINQSDDGGFIAPAVIYAAYAYALSIAISPDTQRDLQLMAIDLAKGDYLAVALDLVGILVPGGTGFGQLSKPTKRIVRKLIRWVDRTLEDVESSSSLILRGNMIKAGIKVPNFANAAHHIVAGNASAAKYSRSILKKFGIGINDAINGVFLSNTYHNRLHTKAYYDKVNYLLGRAKTREDLIKILNYIAQQLREGKF